MIYVILIKECHVTAFCSLWILSVMMLMHNQIHCSACFFYLVSFADGFTFTDKIVFD